MKINAQHSLGKGEVVCSIHTGSTSLTLRNPYTIRSFSRRFTSAYLRLFARERVMNMQPMLGDGFGDGRAGVLPHPTLRFCFYCGFGPCTNACKRK